jgi:hypothetical protein
LRRSLAATLDFRHVKVARPEALGVTLVLHGMSWPILFAGDSVGLTVAVHNG